jgi:solute carrier family 35 protein E1
MYHPSSGYAPQFASNHNEKHRSNDTTRFFDSKNLPLPNGWGDKHPSLLHQLASSAQVALANVRRFAGQLRQSHMNRSAVPGSKPLTARDSGFSTPVFLLLCCLWYTTSALSSNTGKVILSQFRYPITLTFIQFGFVAGYCLLFMTPLIRFSRLRTPTKAIIQSTLPMSMFQVGGHMFTSMAISRIPVSTVHTIKVSPNVPHCRKTGSKFDCRRFRPYSL